MLMPSLRGVVVHDGSADLVWASDEWDLDDDPEIVKDAISNALTDPAEFAGIVRFDADRVVYSFALRGEHIELLGVVSMAARLSGSSHRGAPAAIRAAAGAAGIGVSAPRIVVALQIGIPRAGSWASANAIFR